MTTFLFDVPVLKPQPKERPLIVFRHGKARGVPRMKSVQEETRIVLHARAAARRQKIKHFVGPVKVEIWAYRPWPKRIPESRRDAESVMPTTTPDLPNYDMIVADALEKSGLILNDSTITDIESHKRYRDRGGWIIAITGEFVQAQGHS